MRTNIYKDVKVEGKGVTCFDIKLFKSLTCLLCIVSAELHLTYLNQTTLYTKNK